MATVAQVKQPITTLVGSPKPPAVQNYDYATQIKNAIASGANSNTINQLASQREAKMASDPTKYGNTMSTADYLKSLGYAGNTASAPITDAHGNVYYIGANGSMGTMGSGMPLGAGERYATQDEANKIGGLAAGAMSGATGGTASGTDNTGLINGEYGNLLSAIRAQMQQSINNKNLDINNLDQTYAPQRNTSEVQKSNDLRTTLEQAANAGDRGGIGRQNALETQTAGDNRLNSLNLQENTAKQSLLNDIANLQQSGTQQEATLNAQKIKDLIANNQYTDTTSYNRSQDAISNALNEAGLTGTLNGTRTLSGQSADQTTLANKAAVDAQAHYDNIAGYINQLKAANPNDPEIPYLEAERQGKVNTQKAAQATAEANAAKDKTAAQQMLYDNALKAWQASGTATPDMAVILGVPVGANTASYDMAKINSAISQQNANTSSYNASTSRINANTNSTKASTPKAANTTGGVTTSQIDSYIQKNFITGAVKGTTQKAMSMPDKRNIAAYLTSLSNSPAYSDASSQKMLAQIAAKYGIGSK